MTRRPLCIDSRLVQKIDRLTSQGAETIYRCALNRASPFSSYFNNQHRSLATRIQKMERLLESIEPFQRRVHITIFNERPYLFKAEGHQIFIGEKMLAAPGHLEKALAKIWYHERAPGALNDRELMEEVFTDLILFLRDGDVDIGDPQTHIKTSLHLSRWPRVLKSAAAYCDSPWKRSEDYEACQDFPKHQKLLDMKAAGLSVRPLLLSNGVSAYKSLSLNQRLLFSNNLAKLLKAGHEPALPTADVQEVSSTLRPALRAAEAIKNINLFFSTSKILKNSVTHRIFVAALSNELRQAGFRDSFAEAFFDVLYVSPRPLNSSSVAFKNFMKLAQEQPHVHIALRDRENVWMLPAEHPIPLNSFELLKSSRTIVERCGGFDFNYVMGYADSTEKLLIVENCDSHREFQFGRFLKEGAEGFGSDNKGVAFIQFHLPSLMMKQAELSQVSNVFDLIRKREVGSSIFESLGWQEIKWDERASAYHPKAFIDAIEWFRVL